MILQGVGTVLSAEEKRKVSSAIRAAEPLLFPDDDSVSVFDFSVLAAGRFEFQPWRLVASIRSGGKFMQPFAVGSASRIVVPLVSQFPAVKIWQACGPIPIALTGSRCAAFNIVETRAHLIRLDSGSEKAFAMHCL